MEKLSVCWLLHSIRVWHRACSEIVGFFFSFGATSTVGWCSGHSGYLPTAHSENTPSIFLDPSLRQTLICSFETFLSKQSLLWPWHANWKIVIICFISSLIYAEFLSLFFLIINIFIVLLSFLFLFYMCSVLDNFQSIFSYTIPFDSHGAKKGKAVKVLVVVCIVLKVVRWSAGG